MKKILVVCLMFCARAVQALVVNDLTTLTVNEGVTNAIEGYVVGTNTLVKAGAGELVWTNAFTFAGETRLEAGSIKAVSEPLNMADPVLTNLLGQSVLWFDAADDASFTYNTTTNGDLTVTTNSVETWTDKLSRNTATSGVITAARTQKPNRTGTKNGLPTVDFGLQGNGASMEFPRVTTIRTVFWVVDINPASVMFLLGDTATYHFHRNDTTAAYWGGNTAGNVRDGSTYNNGVRVATPTTTLIPVGYQLIALTTLGNVQANAFCNDRNNAGRFGGQRIAEVMIYDKVLNDAERKAVEAYLRKKWAMPSESTADYNRLSTLTIAGENTAISKEGSGLLVNNFNGTGSVSFPDGAAFENGLVLAGSLGVTIPSGPLLLPTVYGTGTLNPSHPLSATTVTLTNNLTINQAVTLTTLQGEGTFDATSLSVSNVVPNNTATALFIDIPADDRSITNIIANGGTVQTPDLLTVLGKIQVGAGQTLALQNSAAGVTAPLLTGNGSITLPGGAITVDAILASAGETLTINYGGATWTVPPLTGTGKVKFVGTGALTINQPDQFTGTIELAPEVTVTVTGTNPFFNKLEIHGTNTLIFPAGMTECGVTNLIGNGQLQGTNTTTGVTMKYNRIDLTGDLHLIDAGVGPLTVPDVRGTGALTSNRGVAYETITLGGTVNLSSGQTVLPNLGGAGTLTIANVSTFLVGNLSPAGNVSIVNTGSGTVPVTIANLGGTGSLTVTNGLGEAVITNFVAGTDVTFTLNTGTNSVTIRRSFGEGTLVKQGSGQLFFGQHSTLQAVRIANDSKIVALPADVIDNPVQSNLSFWLDASLSNTLTLAKDTANNDVISEWRDVRETYNPWQAASPYDSAYQGTQNAKPVIGRYTLNGRNVADMGPLGSHNDGNARWLQFRDGQTSRTVIIVFGSQAGGGFLLSGANSWNYHRGGGSFSNPLTPLFDGNAVDAVEYGNAYLDGTAVYNPTQVGFNGNYQIVSIVNRNNETAYADRFAYDRNIGGRCGGQRIAEALFYSEKLTDAQRIAVEGYLTAKWKPRMPRLEVATANVEVDTTQSALAIDVIVGTGTVTKTGANDLTVQDAGGLAGTLHISSGKLATTEALYQQTPTGVNNWYDASSTANFTFETDGRINTWKSRVNTPGGDALRNSTDLAWSPYYDPYGLNGKPVVDMGVWNGERRLRLANEFVGVCSAFMVYDSRFGGGWLFGGRTSYNFHRGDNGGNLNAGMVDGTAAATARYSTLWQNGVQTATDLTQAYFKGDWETIALKTSGGVTIGSLGQDRTDASSGLTHRTGGKRLAEVLLYFRTVTTMERLYIERYLNNKWFGRFRNLSFADGTTLELGEGTKDVFVAKITGTGRVTQAGTSKLDVYDTTAFTGTWVADIAKLNLIRKLAPTAPQPTPDNWWLDASKTNTLTLGDGSFAAGGTLNTWADQSVSGASATKVGTVTWRPNLLNGMPVVDLGDSTAANYMTYQNRTVASGFAIFGSQQGGSFLFGHTVNYNFHRSEDPSSTGPLLWGENNDNAASFVRRGQWKMDGDRYDPRRWVSGTVASYRNMSGNYSLYSFATRAGTTANTDQFSRDRAASSGVAGGRQRWGEIIFHSGLIAPTNRAATEAYLMNKWFGKSVHGYVSERAPLFQTLELPAGASQNLTINTGVAGQAVAIGTIIGATNVTSTGTGKLIVGALNATRTVPAGTESVVTGRDVPLANPITDSLDLWVDANSPSEAFSVAGNNGRLNRWSDVRDIGNAAGRGMFAFNDGTALWGSTILGPLLQPNALNGKTVADFGAFNSKNWMGFVTGWNGYRNINTMRTIFWVYNSEAGGGWLMGHISSYQFHRGDQVNNTITKNIPIFAPNDGWAASQVKLGSFYADGQQINPMITGMSGGWQIFSLVTSANAEASTFARDRANSGDAGNVGQRSGGQKLAEMLIYNRVLTETERRDVEAYLAYKWFNRVNNGYRLAQETDVQTVTLAQGSTLTIANANGTFKVGGSGTLTGGVVRVSEVSPNTNGITFASGLTLVDGAVVKRAADGTTPDAGKVTVAGGLTVLGGGTLNVTAISGNVSGQQFPLFGYDTLSGSFASWTLSGVVTGKYTPQFKDNDPANTASVRLNPAGSMIIFQ